MFTYGAFQTGRCVRWVTTAPKETPPSAAGTPSTPRCLRKFVKFVQTLVLCYSVREQLPNRSVAVDVGLTKPDQTHDKSRWIALRLLPREHSKQGHELDATAQAILATPTKAPSDPHGFPTPEGASAL